MFLTQLQRPIATHIASRLSIRQPKPLGKLSNQSYNILNLICEHILLVATPITTARSFEPVRDFVMTTDAKPIAEWSLYA